MISRALLCFALLPLLGHAQSANVVAGLQEDVSALRDEVRKLRAEVEELRDAQTAAAKSAVNKPAAGADTGALNAKILAVDSAQTAARRTDRAEVLAEVDRKVAALSGQVNKALADQTKQVNDALKSGAATRPAEPRVTPRAPDPKPAADTPAPAAPSDMPKTGTKYTVQPGDSVPKIAKKTGSRASWILAANGLKSNADLKAHSVIFIPLPEETPAPASN